MKAQIMLDDGRLYEMQLVLVKAPSQEQSQEANILTVAVDKHNITLQLSELIREVVRDMYRTTRNGNTIHMGELYVY